MRMIIARRPRPPKSASQTVASKAAKSPHARETTTSPTTTPPESQAAKPAHKCPPPEPLSKPNDAAYNHQPIPTTKPTRHKPPSPPMAQPPSPPRNPTAAAQVKQWQETSETEFSWNR